jgi:hypothetical protein
MKSQSIHATPASLGGGVILGLLLLIGVLVWIAFQPQEPSFALRVILSVVWLALAVYFLDAWSERLEFQDGRIGFHSWLRKHREISLFDTDDVLIVHEGLNQQQGIVSARFRERNGETIDLPLGPLWHRHDLEAFFGELEQLAGKKKMVENVR